MVTIGSNKTNNRLILAALDSDDLLIISACLQKVQLQWSKVAYFEKQSSFALGLHRITNHSDLVNYADEETIPSTVNRCLSGLRIHHVRHVQCLNIDQNDKMQELTLLSLHFEQGEKAPEGFLILSFIGAKFIRLAVDCIEIGLQDIDVDHDDSSPATKPTET